MVKLSEESRKKMAEAEAELLIREVEEFGVDVDLDDPCHLWSNDDFQIQEACVRRVEEKYEGKEGGIIFYGPSNLQMWYSLEKDMLPFAAQNHGMGGCVDEEMIRYADRMMYSFKPFAVFFQTGSNDLANGFTLEQILNNKKYMYGEFLKKMPSTKLIVMSGLPLPKRQQYWEDTVKTNALLKEMCEKTERMYFMDASDVMLSEEGSDDMKAYDGRYFRPEYFRADGIHLNKKRSRCLDKENERDSQNTDLIKGITTKILSGSFSLLSK